MLCYVTCICTSRDPIPNLLYAYRRRQAADQPGAPSKIVHHRPDFTFWVCLIAYMFLAWSVCVI